MSLKINENTLDDRIKTFQKIRIMLGDGKDRDCIKNSRYNNMFVEKRIGSNSANGEALLSCTPFDVIGSRTICKNPSFKAVVKRSPFNKNSKVEIENEISVLKLTTKLVLKKVCPNLPLFYKDSFCKHCIFEKEELSKGPCELFIVEHASHGDLCQWLTESRRNTTEWKVALFQIFAGLKVLHSYGLSHNDMHWGNVLVLPGPKNGCTIYKIEDKRYYIPNIGFTFILWDFGKVTDQVAFSEDYSRISYVTYWAKKEKIIFSKETFSFYEKVQKSADTLPFKHFDEFLEPVINPVETFNITG